MYCSSLFYVSLPNKCKPNLIFLQAVLNQKFTDCFVLVFLDTQAGKTVSSHTQSLRNTRELEPQEEKNIENFFFFPISRIK